MIIKSTLKYDNKEYNLEYHDCDDFYSLPYEKCTQIYGVCFYKEKIVIGFGTSWSLIGGTIERSKKEDINNTLIREIQEESNMKVLESYPIGYQIVTDNLGNSIYQLRSVAKVEPIGKFEKDPDNDIKKIKLIEPSEYSKYFDWGEIGERIIQRAIELKQRYNI